MADANVTIESPAVTPHIIERARAEMARLTAAADWAALVAECAARGDE